MAWNWIKTGLAALSLLTGVNASAQDLIARQAPIDRKLKAVDSLALQRQLKAEEAKYSAFSLYPGWDTNRVHVYGNGVEIPDSFRIDLTGFAMPTTNTRITSVYGPRRYRMHNGLDVKVNVGDTIVAAFDGKVRIVNYERKGYGKYIVIRHTNGLETIYGHLSKQLVSVDETVKAGQVIGLGGNTGRSTGSHLHFETRFLGIALNPALLFDFTKQDVTADSYLFTKKRSRYGSGAAGTSGGARYYKVKKGDTLSRIAAKHGVSVSTLCKLNRITTKSILRPGQVLRCS